MVAEHRAGYREGSYRLSQCVSSGETRTCAFVGVRPCGSKHVRQQAHPHIRSYWRSSESAEPDGTNVYTSISDTHKPCTFTADEAGHG